MLCSIAGVTKRPVVREKVNTNRQQQQHQQRQQQIQQQQLQIQQQQQQIQQQHNKIDDMSALLQGVPDAQMSLLQAAVSNAQGEANPDR